MKFLIAVFILLPISIMGAKYLSRGKGIKLGVTNIILTGTEYILVGILLGSSVLNFIDKNTIIKFKPFLMFGLTWVGYLYGIQFEFRQLKKLPARYFSITFIQAFFTFFSVFFGIFFLSPDFISISFEKRIVFSVFLSVIAMSTAPLALNLVNKYQKPRNQKLFNLLKYISSVDSLFSLLLFSVLLAYMTSTGFPSFNPVSILINLILSVAVGIIPGFLVSYLLRSLKNQREFSALFLGLIALTGGLSVELGVSSLISGLFGGILLANLINRRIDALLFLREAEHSAYIVVLLLIGAGVDLSVKIEVGLLLIFIFLRFFGKLGGNFIALKIFPAKFRVPSLYGVALLSEGGIGFAILINFVLLFPSYTESIFMIILISSLITEFISPKIIITMFNRGDSSKGEMFKK